MGTPRRGFMLALFVVVAFGGLPSPASSQSPSSAPSLAELEKLVAPIALYPDPLVAQILPASTHPVQVVEAARALADGRRPEEAEASQWDPSVQALLSFPTVVKMMNAKLEWTTNLGQAVAANQSAVMAAIQTVRRQAQTAGNLKSNDKQVVVVQGGGDVTTIVIQPASPQVIYVPQYDPVAILAPPPPYYYAYAAAPPPAYGLMSFGVGFAAGAATAYACDWGHGSSGSVTVNNTYKYSQTNNYNAYSSTSTNAKYNTKTGAYTGYDSKTGTYGAYNPETGKYATYNPSTGAYNKSGTTGTYDKPSSTSSSSTYHPPSSSDVAHSTDDYRSAYHGGQSPSSAYHGGSGGGSGSWGSHSDGFHGGGYGGDGFRGVGGGGWGAREASARGSESFGGRGFRR